MLLVVLPKARPSLMRLDTTGCHIWRSALLFCRNFAAGIAAIPMDIFDEIYEESLEEHELIALRNSLACATAARASMNAHATTQSKSMFAQASTAAAPAASCLPFTSRASVSRSRARTSKSMGFVPESFSAAAPVEGEQPFVQVSIA